MSKSGGNPTNAPVPNRNENFGISGCLNETISSNFHYEVVMGLDIFHSVLISMPSGPSKEQYAGKEEKGWALFNDPVLLYMINSLSHFLFLLQYFIWFATGTLQVSLRETSMMKHFVYALDAPLAV